jgi:uncharacterized damage-inducible protein DinB
MSDMWLDPAEDPRESGVIPRGEKAVVTEYLRAYRLTLAMKCQDLDPEQMARRSVPPSTMSLLGLVRHMAGVEHTWFQRTLQGQDAPRLYQSPEDRDLDFNGAVADQAVVDDAFATWREQVRLAEAYLDGVEDLGATVRLGDDDVEIRDIVVHMVEEYARHCGHADLLRECVDGRVGQ